MNRTIEQWQKVDCEHVAKNASQAHVMYLLQDAVSDLQELARQRDQFKKLALEYAGKLAAKSADDLLAELER